MDVPEPIRIAVELAFARMVDSIPHLAGEVRTGAPIILIDVADEFVLSELRSSWRTSLLGDVGQVLYLDKADLHERREDYRAAALIRAEPVKVRDRDNLDRAVLKVLSWGVPMIGLSPSTASHMPQGLIAAAQHRLVLPALDVDIVARTIRLVTGKHARVGDLRRLTMPFEPLELAVAIRHDRVPAECVDELRRLQNARSEKRGARDVSLDELHGLDPAVAWAKGTLADLDAWRRGEIGWDAIDHGVVLEGPPGTGKTLFAKVFANASGLPLIVGSLSKWQASGEAHLGHLLRAMRQDFELARSQIPAIIFIDEVDSFPNRSSLTHSHRDYQIEVVNAFLENLDSIHGREGLIFIAASNDVSRCDPAIIRSGRLNRIIQIGLPDMVARAKMLRVRLGKDLPDADLDRVGRLTERMTGADIEKLVKDARRAARQSNRSMNEADLLVGATAQEAGWSPELTRRFAVHEAGHAVVAVLLGGPENVIVALQSRDGMTGWLARRHEGRAGTRTEIESEIAVLLGGRAAEELIYGEPSAGSGGVLGSDLHQATRLAAGMVGSFGQAGPHPHLFVSPLSDTAEILSIFPLRAAAAEILQNAHARARDLIVAHRPALDRVVEQLIETRRLDGHAVADLIERDHKVPRRRENRLVGRRTPTASTGSEPSSPFDIGRSEQPKGLT